MQSTASHNRQQQAGTLCAIMIFIITMLACGKGQAEVLTYEFRGQLTSNMLFGDAEASFSGSFIYDNARSPSSADIKTDGSGFQTFSRSALPGPLPMMNWHFPEVSLSTNHDIKIIVYNDYTFGGTRPPADILWIFTDRLYSTTNLNIPPNHPAIQFGLFLEDTSHSAFDSAELPSAIPDLTSFDAPQLFWISGNNIGEVTQLYLIPEPTGCGILGGLCLLYICRR